MVAQADTFKKSLNKWERKKNNELVLLAQSNTYTWTEKWFISKGKGRKAMSHLIAERKAFSAKRMNQSNKSVRLRWQKGSFTLFFPSYSICCTRLCFLFTTPKPRPFVCARNAFAGCYIVTAPCECFPDTHMTLCSKAAISWKQSIHGFLNDHHKLCTSNEM